MGYASASFDPALVATNSDLASSAFAEANAASGAAAAASDVASNALSKITARSSVWDKASTASSVASAAYTKAYALPNYVAVNDANRINTSLTEDYIVAFIALTAARQYQISSEDIAQARRIFIIKDASGNAGTYNITISTEGAETIDGEASITIHNDYGARTLYSNGSNLFII